MDGVAQAHVRMYGVEVGHRRLADVGREQE